MGSIVVRLIALIALALALAVLAVWQFLEAREARNELADAKRQIAVVIKELANVQAAYAEIAANAAAATEEIWQIEGIDAPPDPALCRAIGRVRPGTCPSNPGGVD